MSIKKISVLLNCIILCLVVTALLALFNYSNMVNELTVQYENRNALVVLSEELRQSSRDLTANVRMYVVTGDTKYEETFQAVLDERAGVIPRLSTRQYYPDEKRVLLDIIQQFGVEDAELAYVREAERLSNNLAGLEVEAMNITKGLYKDGEGKFTIKAPPDKDKAIELVFGQQYMQYVIPIMQQLDKFIWQLNARMNQVVADALEKVAQSRLILIGCMAAIFIFAIIAMFFYLKFVVAPLRNVVDEMHQVAAGEGDLSSRLPVNSNNEIGQLSSNFNNFMEQLHGLISTITGLSERLATSIEEIKGGSGNSIPAPSARPRWFRKLPPHCTA